MNNEHLLATEVIEEFCLSYGDATGGLFDHRLEFAGSTFSVAKISSTTTMSKEVMDRRASDNEYLHKDFHAALSVGIQYVDQHYGEEAVRLYLRRFTLKYYAPLMADFRAHGLPALRAHFEKIYRDEQSEVEITGDADELRVQVRACPAVTHIRRNNQVLARLFSESTRVVNETLCEGTPFQAELLDYNPKTGAGIQRFSHKPQAPRSPNDSL